MPQDQAKRIRSKVELYARNPSDLSNNVKALAGSNYIRLRVGDWRIIMDDAGMVLDVVKIAPRGSVYK